MESVIAISNLTVIGMMLCMLVYVGTYLERINKKIKDIQEKQFDADEVMKLYAKKYAPKPQIITENHDVVPIYAYYELPHWAEKNVTEDEILNYLTREISNQIAEYIEIKSERDIVKMGIKYSARLQVIDMLNGTTTYKN